MNRCLTYWIMTLFLGNVLCSQSAEPGLSSERLDAICNSVVRITSIPDARPDRDAQSEPGRKKRPEYGTGFVIASHGKRIIITAAHVLKNEFKNASGVTALLPGSSEGIPCDLIDVNDEVDLMALMPQQPINTPPLEISHRALRRGDYVCLFGQPWGIDVVQDRGEFKGEWTAAKVNEQLPSENKSVRIPRGQTRLIVYNSPNAPGKSGGPLVDRDGRVVGVDNSRLPDGPGECLAINIKELDKLKLDSPPDPMFKKAVAMLHVPLSPAAQPMSTRTWLKGSSEDKEGAHFLRIADVSCDANEVVRNCFSHSASFDREVGVEKLQQILNKQPLEKVVNFDFGFKILVPKGYRCVSDVTDSPSGVRLTVTSDDGNVAAPYNTFTVDAFAVPDRLIRLAKRVVNDELDTGAYEALGKRKNGRSLQAGYLRALLANEVAGLMNPAFPVEFLKLRIRDPNGGSILGTATKGDVFRAEDLIERPRYTPWFRENLVSESSDLCYAVHGLVLDDVAIVCNYAFRKSDVKQTAGEQPKTSNYLEHVIMRSSLAFD